MTITNRDYRAQTRTAQAARRLGNIEAKQGDPYELITDMHIRDILLVHQKDLKKQTAELVELSNRLAIMEKQLQSMRQSQSTSYAAILRHGHQVQQYQQSQQTSGNKQSGSLDSHVDARLKGLTREMRIRANDGTELDRALMLKLLGDESGKRMLDGVTWHLQPKIKAVQVLARDERHRQQVLRQVKRNARKHSISVKVTCWLSPQQRANKSTIYTMVQQTNKQVQTQDWGDRVLLIREPRAQGDPVLRWVVSTSLAQVDMVAQLEKIWGQWGIATARKGPKPAATTTPEAPIPPRAPPKPPNVIAAPATERHRKVPGGGSEPAGGKWQAVDRGAKKKLRSHAVATPSASTPNRQPDAPKRELRRPHGKDTIATATHAVKPSEPIVPWRKILDEAQMKAKDKPGDAMEVENPPAGPSTMPEDPPAPPVDIPPPTNANQGGISELPELPEDSEIDE